MKSYGEIEQKSKAVKLTAAALVELDCEFDRWIENAARKKGHIFEQGVTLDVLNDPLAPAKIQDAFKAQGWEKVEVNGVMGASAGGSTHVVKLVYPFD